jgi:predicted TIM-barrel fold metal-dependent hydrolase
VPSYYTGPVVDCDIHHGWKSPHDVIAYLPKRWQEYAYAAEGPAPAVPTNAATANSEVAVVNTGHTGRGKSATAPFYPKNGVINFNIAHGAMMRTSFPPDGSWPGTDYETLREQVLDKHGVALGILTFNIGTHANVDNQHFALALTRAIHDWNAEQWLSGVDDRLYGVAAPALAWPAEAAKEIRRVAKNPRIVSLLLPGSPLGLPYGDPVYDPVFKAAADCGLVVDMHPGASSRDANPSGKAMTSIMAPPLSSREAMRHITSFVVHGTFERFPSLRVHVKEHGSGWLPHLLWKLDEHYDLLRLESPWVKRWPSEYVLEHVSIGTQPLDDCADPKDLQQIFETVDGIDDVLVFSSDYPHVSYNDPPWVSRRLPSSWWRKVFVENACKLYGWDAPADTATGGRAMAAV